MSDNPEDKELKLNDAMFVEYVQKNLAEVQADTAQMQAELENLNKAKEKLMDDQNRALKIAGLPVFTDSINLLPSLKKVDSKTEEMIRQLTKLIDEKVHLDEAYAKHCKKAKTVTEKHLKRGYDQYTSMSDKDLIKFIDQMEKNIEETVAKTALIKAELAQKKKEFNDDHKAVMKDIAALAQVEQDAIEQLEHLQLEKALGNDVTPD